jgi:hypothetical protein
MDSAMPQKYGLEQNFPNPCNPKTQIHYSIPEKVTVSLKVYNLLGQEVMTLYDGVRPAGNYIATFDGRECCGGIYLYQLQVHPTNAGRIKNFEETKKLILLK